MKEVFLYLRLDAAFNTVTREFSLSLKLSRPDSSGLFYVYKVSRPDEDNIAMLSMVVAAKIAVAVNVKVINRNGYLMTTQSLIRYWSALVLLL